MRYGRSDTTYGPTTWDKAFGADAACGVGPDKVLEGLLLKPGLNLQ